MLTPRFNVDDSSFYGHVTSMYEGLLYIRSRPSSIIYFDASDLNLVWLISVKKGLVSHTIPSFDFKNVEISSMCNVCDNSTWLVSSIEVDKSNAMCIESGVYFAFYFPFYCNSILIFSNTIQMKSIRFEFVILSLQFAAQTKFNINFAHFCLTIEREICCSTELWTWFTQHSHSWNCW